MTVRAAYRIDETQVQNMDMTISITMKVEEWRALMRAIPGTGYECHHVGAAIAEALGDVTTATAQAYSYPR